MTHNLLLESLNDASAETIAALRLIRSPGIGPVTYRGVISRFGSACAALDALASRSSTPRKDHIRFTPVPMSQIEDEFLRLKNLGGKLIGIASEAYPRQLAEIPDAPPFLTAIGDISHLRRPAIAIVGARNASSLGRKMAGALAQDLSDSGLTVWSGLARGIDTAAHSAAVKQSTVAVMAGGADVVYPKENRDLHSEIITKGTIVSEMPLATEPQAQYFPRRNRLISGSSLGVIIVEGTPKSGSLITARFALDQGRDVFAVPGSPLDPRAQGPNNLIRDGAILVRDANDVLDEVQTQLGLFSNPERDPPEMPQPIEYIDEKDVSELQEQILGEIGTGSVTVDELRRQCQVSAPILASALLELELDGRIERLPGNRIGLLAT